MKNCYNLDGVKTYLEREIERTAATLDAWGRVTFPTKKDGNPFAALSKNFSGCKLSPVSYAMQAGENELTIYTRCSPAGYYGDSIRAYELWRYIPENDPRKAKPQNLQPKVNYLEQVYTYDLEDCKAAIAARIDYLRGALAALEKQLAAADAAYNAFRSAYAAAIAELETNSGKEENSTLYYAILETIKERFPYC